MKTRTVKALQALARQGAKTKAAIIARESALVGRILRADLDQVVMAIKALDVAILHASANYDREHGEDIIAAAVRRERRKTRAEHRRIAKRAAAWFHDDRDPSLNTSAASDSFEENAATYAERFGSHEHEEGRSS
jgi:hypothetical protein